MTLDNFSLGDQPDFAMNVSLKLVEIDLRHIVSG
jgi:hypothetical protein